MKTLLILSSFLLCACQCKCPPPHQMTETEMLQQPAELFLYPKTRIATNEGIYTSGKNVEMWHSHKQYLEMQEKVTSFRPFKI